MQKKTTTVTITKGKPVSVDPGLAASVVNAGRLKGRLYNVLSGPNGKITKFVLDGVFYKVWEAADGRTARLMTREKGFHRYGA